MVKKSVLVVDDERGFRDMYVYLLEPLGIEVTCASNGREAVEKVKEKAYDLLLMDVHMPELTGPEAFKQIQKIRPAQKVAIFTSSSDPTYTLENQALQEGAVGCFYKPVDVGEILKVLNQVLQ